MVSSMITNYLIKASIIGEKQRELYEYSIKSLFGNVLNIVSCLAIGVLCGECVRAIIFLLVMVPLRSSPDFIRIVSSIGGCHLKSSLLCFFTSCAIVLVCIFLPNYLIFLPDWFYLLMAGIGMGLISIIAPVDCIEKPMDMEDKKKMHIRVRYLICLLFVLYFVLYIFGKKQLCVELVLVVECALATLIIELIQKYFTKSTID